MYIANCGNRVLSTGLVSVGAAALIAAPIAPPLPELNIPVPQIAFTNVQLTATPVETVINFITSGLTGLAGQARDALLLAGEAASDTFLAPVDQVITLLDGLGNPLASAAADIINGARDAVGEGPAFYADLVNATYSSFVAIVTSAGNTLTLALDGPVQAISDLVSGIGDAVTSILAGDIQGGFQNLVTGVTTGLSTLTSALSDAVSEIVGLAQSVTESITSLGQSFADGLASIPQHLAQGFADALAELGLGGGALRVSAPSAAAILTGSPANALPSDAPTVDLSVSGGTSPSGAAGSAGADLSGAAGNAGADLSGAAADDAAGSRATAHARPDHRRPSAKQTTSGDKSPTREGGTGRSARSQD
jgi:hypothetical protein